VSKDEKKLLIPKRYKIVEVQDWNISHLEQAVNDLLKEGFVPDGHPQCSERYQGWQIHAYLW